MWRIPGQRPSRIQSWPIRRGMLPQPQRRHLQIHSGKQKDTKKYTFGKGNLSASSVKSENFPPVMLTEEYTHERYVSSEGSCPNRGEETVLNAQEYSETFNLW